MPEPQIKQGEAAVQTLEEISSDGDVILAVGPDKKKMRVKSNYLRTASRVFDSMFGPNWAEGQNLSRCVNCLELFKVPIYDHIFRT
jgi:hypothetical protein